MPAILKYSIEPTAQCQPPCRMVDNRFWGKQDLDAALPDSPCKLKVLSSSLQEILVKSAKLREEVPPDSKIATPKQPTGKILDDFFERMIRLVRADRLTLNKDRFSQRVPELFRPRDGLEYSRRQRMLPNRPKPGSHQSFGWLLVRAAVPGPT